MSLLRRVLLGTGFALALASAPASAEPYIALLSGQRCSACHVNQTGGGLRNELGTTYGRRSLPWKRLKDPESLWDGVIADRFRVGTDLRAEYRAKLRDDDAFLGEYDVSAANLYGEFELLPERLRVYADVDVGGTSRTREIFGLISTRKATTYVKAGRFFLPYGLRLQDDDAFTRSVTGFNFDESDTGVEVGGFPGLWTLVLSATNGSSGGDEQDNGKQFTGTAAYVRKGWRLGLSGSTNDLPGDNLRTLGGLFGGFRAGRVVGLFEVDLIRNEEEGQPKNDQVASHFELDITPFRGLTVRAWYGEFEPDTDVGTADQEQAGVGVDWTAWPGLQLRLFYRFRDGPEDVAGTRDDEAVAEMHFYF